MSSPGNSFITFREGALQKLLSSLLLIHPNAGWNVLETQRGVVSPESKDLLFLLGCSVSGAKWGGIYFLEAFLFFCTVNQLILWLEFGTYRIHE